ncbi:MAG: hydantoinase B/oxoprolinase family protein [Nitratireductor sp.]
MDDSRLTILQMRLDGIAQAMQDTLFRCAVSPVVREGNDAAAALMAADGELLALSDAIPLLLGALQGSVEAILSHYPADTMRSGDLYFMNDPYSGGTHLPDITVVMPVFAGPALIGLAATILHHQDVGGIRAGSVPPDAVEIFQEGLRLPPMRLGQGGAVDPAIKRLIEANSRAPATVLGDIGAQIAAANRATEALGTLASELGTDGFLTAAAACRDRAEAQIRAVIDALPPGPFFGLDGLDPTPGLPDIDVHARLTCADGHFDVDFTGTTPQVAAPINCVRSGPLAAVFYALLSLAGPALLRNGGVLRAIRLTLPEACIINARPPAAVNARMGVVRATTSAVLQAVAQAAPEQMPAANSGMSYVLAFSGRNDDGAPFLVTEIIAGGAGGGPRSDGAPGISTDVGNAMNMPAEALEGMIPVRLVSAQIRQGSGGAGRYRGGDGICRVYEALADAIAVSLRGERFHRAPEGLRGGSAPAHSQARILRANGTQDVLSSRSAVTLDKGDRLVVESCGGAGYGAPGIG